MEYMHRKGDFSQWRYDAKQKALVTKGSLSGKSVMLVEPETKMNLSGNSLEGLITSAKKAERLVVIYDDIDLPLGRVKISFGRGSGGHKGLESVIKKIRTKDFVRFRVGISPPGKKGSVKKPRSEQGVIDFILGDFSSRERTLIDKTIRRASEEAEMLVVEGLEKTRNTFN